MFIPDIYFHNKFIIRYLTYNKFIVPNIFIMPTLKNVYLTFNIYDLIDSDDLCLSNYFYLIRFFFGKKAFLIKFATQFRLNITYYNFCINFLFNNRNYNLILNFLIFDILPFLNKKYLNIFITYDNKINLTFLDMNFFTENYGNLGFFNLKHELNIQLQFSSNSDDILDSNFFKLRA